MMKSSNKKSLSSIEDTNAQHVELDKVAKLSSQKVVELSLENAVEVTYLEGEVIVKLDKFGNKIQVGTVENNRRKVSVGQQAKLSKK